jgi:hypothetical protein
MEQFKTTPPGVKPYGVTDVVSERLARGIAGQYISSVWRRGTIRLKSSVARDLATQLRAGGVATFAGSDAIRILTHEMFHAASHPDYEYESHSLSRRPHAAMQEATTEVLAQLHKGKVMVALGVTPLPRDSEPLFRGYESTLRYYEKDRPSGKLAVFSGKPTAYPTYIRQFGRIVAAVEGTTDGLDQKADRWAREIKGTRGTMRYYRMADALIEKRMPRPSRPESPGAEERERYYQTVSHFQAARERVVGSLKEIMQGDQEVDHIDRVVDAHIQNIREGK